MIFLIVALSLLLGLPGIRWGLPSAERNGLYFSSESGIRRSLEGVDSEAVTVSMSEKKEGLSGSAFAPIKSYHPDESNFIKAVSNMKPKKLDFNPHYLYYGTLYVYSFAAALAAGAVFRVIKPTTDILFYFLNPGEIAKFYVAGRLVSVLFAALLVFIVYRASRKLYGENAGLIAALFTALSPALVVNSHFLSVDVTMSFFVFLTMLFAARILSSGELKWYVLAGICAGLAAQSKYNAALVALAVPVAGLLRTCGKKTDILLCWFEKKALLSYACALGIFILFLLPFVFTTIPEFSRNFSAGMFRIGPRISSVASNTVFFTEALYHGMGLPLFLLAAAGVVMAVMKREKADIFFIFWIAINMLILVIMSPLGDRHMRYLLIILPALAVLAARFMAAVCAMRPANKVVPVLIALVACVPTLLFSAGYDRVFMQENTRTSAGKWIAQNIPAGSSIGLRRDPWQYETPPVNQAKYRLCITGKLASESAKAIAEKKPGYFVISNAEYIGYREEWNSVLKNAGYGLVKEFSNPPRVFGVAFNNSAEPADDYTYFYPEIRIYKSEK